MEIRKYVVEDAGTPLKGKGQQNDYSCFNAVHERQGVYVFQRRNDGLILYVGQAGSGEVQRLRERVKQHYVVTDTGGKFHINWRSKHCDNCCHREKNGKKILECVDGEECEFSAYENLLHESRVIFFYSEDGNATKEKVDALEAFLLLSLRPRYDSRSMQMRLDRISEITDGEILDFVVSRDDNENIVGTGSERRVRIDSTTCGGRPRIRGTRIRVSDILDHLANSVSQAEILADFPDLSEEDLKAALAFGARASDRSGAASG